jgi:hypothetical protein
MEVPDLATVAYTLNQQHSAPRSTALHGTTAIPSAVPPLAAALAKDWAALAKDWEAQEKSSLSEDAKEWSKKERGGEGERTQPQPSSAAILGTCTPIQ